MANVHRILGVLFVIRVAYGVLQVPALGRPSDLASFYDANKDEFHPVSALTGRFPVGSVVPTIRSNVDCTSSIIENLDSKLSSIGLTLRSKVDVLTGVIGMSGAIGYAQENTYDAHSVYGAVHYKRYTMYEMFHTRLDQVQSQLSLSPARILPATHVVIGVMWGVDILISFRFRKSHMSSTSVSSAEVESSLKKMAYSVQVGSKLDTSKSNTVKFSDTEIKIFGDLLLPIIPTTIEEVEELLKNIPNILNTTSSKGQPQYFDLLETDKLQSIINSDSEYNDYNSSYKPLGLDQNAHIVGIETSLLQIYEQKEKTMSEIIAYRTKLHKLEFMFSNEVIQAIDKLYSKYESTFSVFNARFKNLILKCRIGVNKELKANFFKIKNNYMEHKFGPVKALLKLEELVVNASSKIADYEVFKKNRVFMARKDYTTNQLRLEHANETVLFLYYTEGWKQQQSQIWNEMSNWFVRQNGVKFVVDCELGLHRSHSCPFLNDRQIGNKLVVIRFDQKTNAKYENNMFRWLDEAVNNEKRLCMRTLACQNVQKRQLSDCLVQEAINYWAFSTDSKGANKDLCKNACL